MSEWRAIPGYVGAYEASDRGDIRNARTGRVLRQGNGRYRSVMLSIDAVKTRHNVHRLVALAFRGKRLGFVRHLNGNAWDNRAVNLAWGTPTENNLDTIRHGRNTMQNRTSCPKGHIYSEENTMIRAKGHKICRTCNRERMAARRAKRVSS